MTRSHRDPLAASATRCMADAASVLGGGNDFVKKAIKIIDTISTWIGIPSSWLIIPLMLITCYDVTARYFFSAPTQWAYDYSYMMYGTMFMLVGAYTLAQNNHVRGDVFYRLFPVRAQAALDILLYAVFFFPGIISLVVAGYYFAEMSWRFGERSMMTPGGPPIYPFKIVIPVAGFFTVLQGIAEVLRCVIALKTGVWPERFEDVQEAP
jgi:TRAP-type mannitol/chloroaromatic compound transport system permease small subunit